MERSVKTINIFIIPLPEPKINPSFAKKEPDLLKRCYIFLKGLSHASKKCYNKIKTLRYTSKGWGTVKEEIYARLILSLIGLALGSIPLIYGIVRHQIVAGVVSALVCGGISAVGLPYACLLVAPGACYLVYVLARNKDESDRKRNRSAYKKHVQQEMQSPDIRTSGFVENRDVANNAWPPVNQVMDAQAAADYQQLTARAESDPASND